MFSYLPLAHGYETAVEFALMILGSLYYILQWIFAYVGG